MSAMTGQAAFAEPTPSLRTKTPIQVDRELQRSSQQRQGSDRPRFSLFCDQHWGTCNLPPSRAPDPPRIKMLNRTESVALHGAPSQMSTHNLRRFDKRWAPERLKTPHKGKGFLE